MAFNTHNKQVLLTQDLLPNTTWNNNLLDVLYCKKFRFVWFYSPVNYAPGGNTNNSSGVLCISINNISTTKTTFASDSNITVVIPQPITFNNTQSIMTTNNNQWYDVPEGKFKNFQVSLFEPNQTQVTVVGAVPNTSNRTQILIETTDEDITH